MWIKKSFVAAVVALLGCSSEASEPRTENDDTNGEPDASGGATMAPDEPAPSGGAVALGGMGGTVGGGVSTGGSYPTLTAGALDLPVRIEGECWESASSESPCDRVPLFDPPLIADGAIHVPADVCASIIYRNPEALSCTPGLDCSGVSGWVQDDHEGPSEATLPLTGWRVILAAGGCAGDGMGGAL